jgi:DNA transposition AAA+ family ATPase
LQTDWINKSIKQSTERRIKGWMAGISYLSSVNVLLSFRASAKATAPSSPMLLFHKLIGSTNQAINQSTERRIKGWMAGISYLSSVNVLLSFRASAKATAPSSPMSLKPKLIGSTSQSINQRRGESKDGWHLLPEDS